MFLTDGSQNGHYGNYKKNNFGLDLGFGAYKDADGALLELGLRYLYNFNPYIGWDALGAKVVASTDDLVDNMIVKVLTGVRANSPEFNNISAYYTMRFGYGYWIDAEEGGMAYELGFGMMFRRRYLIGYNYDFQKVSVFDYDFKIKGHMVRIGFNF